MPQVIVVSKTRMQTGLCIGGFDLTTNRSLRLLPRQEHAQPVNAPFNIGDVWEINYELRGSQAPFVEDADAVAVGQRITRRDVAEYVAGHAEIVVGDTNVIYQGKLHWNTGHKGFIEPADPSGFSTQFWRPTSFLNRYDDSNREGRSVFWEPETRHRIPWVGVAAPPDRIDAGTLVRVSLGRPYAGTEDHPVCWLQLSGVY